MKEIPLGQMSHYPERYSPELLYPVSRAENRVRLGIGEGLVSEGHLDTEGKGHLDTEGNSPGIWPWFGEDRWQAFELSWLAPNGVPKVAIGDIRVPAASPNIIESKSLKLYCNSLNQAVFQGDQAVRALMAEDLSRAAGAAVMVELISVDVSCELLGRPAGFVLLDELPITIRSYEKDPSLLQVRGESKKQQFCSHLLKSNCPVTGQPDWGSLLISLDGPEIDQEGLLAYIVGYRNTQDFHEHCVESIFVDLMQAIGPDQLTVSAQYTRRGGLDINPWRSTAPGVAPTWRLARQ